MSETKNKEFVLLLSCRDSKGLVYAVSGLLYQAGCSIIDSQQFGDASGDDGAGLFFMRIHFDSPPATADAAALRDLFGPLLEKYRMTAHFHDLEHKARVLILVSKEGHCLNDLLFRRMDGHLPIQIMGVISNHTDCEDLVRSYDLPFHHIPMAAGIGCIERCEQEEKIEALVRREQIDLVVLARYMQVLSPKFCALLKGRAINIHHSFLPSFKGAKPYAQAHDRGVKLIGATAHYVTPELDEGPIIEQDVERVDHRSSAIDLAALGRDIESMVLARAVKWHSEHRILLNGHKTIVFR